MIFGKLGGNQIIVILISILVLTQGFTFTESSSFLITDILNTTYQYDNVSQLLSVITNTSEPISYIYDANVNLTTKEGTNTEDEFS